MICFSSTPASVNVSPHQTFYLLFFLIFSHYVIYGFPLWNHCKQMLRWLRINASRCKWKHDSYMTLAEKLKLLWYMYCLVAGIMDNCIVWETYDDYFEKLALKSWTFYFLLSFNFCHVHQTLKMTTKYPK